MRRWAKRYVKNGVIRLNGETFYPPEPLPEQTIVGVDQYLELLKQQNYQPQYHCPYDGRWEGKQALVSAYQYPDNEERWSIYIHSFVEDNGAWPGQTCIGGWFLWDIWKTQ